MLKGKTAIVTGSTSGIGLGIARIMAMHGANIVLNGFGDVEAAKRVLAEFDGSGAQLFEFAAPEAGGSCLGQLRLVPSDVAGDELISLSLGAPLSAREMRLAEFAALHRLTPAESRVMIALVDDLSPAQVAQRLNISPGTVRSHALPLMSLPPR